VGKERNPNHPSPPFKKKEMEGEGEGYFAWWSMEGEGEGSFVWWSMEGEGEGSFAWWSMEGEGEGSFAWWSMEGEGEGSLLGGQWKEKEKVLCLVANGRRRRRFLSTYSHFPPSNFI
jgi:hypothetical protein